MFDDEQDVDRELRRMMTAAPSAGFDARILERVSRPEPRPASWRWMQWAAAAAVVALVVAGARETAQRPPRRPDGQVGREIPGRPDLQVGRHTPRRPGLQLGRQAARASTRPPESRTEVLVPAGQLDAIYRIVRDVNAGRLMLPMAPPDDPVVIVVEPVHIEPIPVPGVEPAGGLPAGPKTRQ